MEQDRGFYEGDYQVHFQTRYVEAGRDWEQCSVAYRFGYDLAQNQRNRAREWADIEPEARKSFQQRHASLDWREMRDAVLYSFERARHQLRTGGQGISNRRNAPGDLGRQEDGGTIFGMRNHMDTASGEDKD